MKIVDAKGLLCPQPLIMAKKGLKEISSGDTIGIYCDNETSLKNLMTFLQDQDAKPSFEETEQGVFLVKASKPMDFNQEVDAAAYCSPALVKNDYVIAVKNDKMGSGDDALGEILMKAFINSLSEQDTLPTHVVFYNAGVKLAVKQSAVIDALVDLEAKGIRIIVCGTCVDFFGLKSDLGVGMISNMYTITEVMVNAHHIVEP